MKATSTNSEAVHRQEPGTSRTRSMGAAPAGRTGRPARHLWLRYVGRATLYLAIGCGAAIMLIPFLWMLSSSLKRLDQVFAYPPVWIPAPIVWENYAKALVTVNHPFLARFFPNTIFVALASVLGQALSCSIAGFGFARLRFPGRRILFLLVLSTMAVPFYTVMIPQFILFRELGWLNSYKPLIVPTFFAGSGFFIFLFRQFFSRIPAELFDSARIDGCNTAAIFTRIAVPLSKPVFATVFIMGFTSHWNDFLAPLLYLSDSRLHTVSIGLAYFRSDFGVEWPTLMAASTAVLLPNLLIFFFFQGIFIQGIVITGVKG